MLLQSGSFFQEGPRLLAAPRFRDVTAEQSRAALEIGKRLFDEHPLIGTAVYPPTFLHFNGRTLELPDESVDRIVCFDALHHVPNVADVLREFGRVLKPGGIAGFSEPGRRHAESPQSQYEMQNYAVLENNIDVNEIFAWAKPAGFTRLAMRVALDMEMSLDEQNTLFAPPHGPEHESPRSCEGEQRSCASFG